MDGYIKIATEIDTKNFDAEIKYIENQMEEIEDKIKQADMGFEVGDVDKLEAKYSKLSKQLVKLVQKQKELGKTNFTPITESINNVGSAVGKTIRKIAKWSLAVFSLRSAYMGIRNAMSTLTQQDEQLAADVEYMKNALAYALEPIVRGIVNLMKQLMFYVGYIIKAWTGKNIFENANKSLKGANASAKQLSKTLAGFDEMNVVSDSSSGGGGGVTPSFDLSSPEDVPIPSWLQWIADNGDTVKNILIGIGSAIAGIKVVNLLNDLELLGEGFSKFKKLLLGLGIGLIIYGIYETIKGIVKFVKDPSWENFANILKGLAIILAGVAIAMLAVNAANPVAWIVLAIAAVVALVAAIIKYWDKIKEVLGKVGSWIYDHVIKPVTDFFVNMYNKIIGVFKKIGTKAADVIGSAFKTVINGVLKAIETVLNTPIKAINGLIKVINKVPGIELSKLSEFKLPRLAVGGIVNMPGKGINYGGANIGERGAEGVIPLTNSQMMEELGATIGKYITINANITNTMNGRVISRELQKIQNANDFATNS